ncbi:MAG: hypothetical protein ACLTBS_07880 [Eisenbergiella sp.]
MMGNYLKENDVKVKGRTSEIVAFAAVNFAAGYNLMPIGLNLAYALLSILGMGLAVICIVFFYNHKQANKKNSVFKMVFLSFLSSTVAHFRDFMDYFYWIIF